MRNVEFVTIGSPAGSPLRRLLRARLAPPGMLALAAVLAAGVAAAGWTARAPAPASRAQIEEWQAMVAQASEPRALQKLRELARHGSGDAQAALGVALLGAREPGLRDEGFGWLETAAHGGARDGKAPASARAAQLALGKALLLGSGVARDYPRALALLRPVAAAGDPAAGYYLGLMYRSGYGTPADPAAAARWFEQAARQGIPAAQFMLANAYRDGSGVPRDEARALELYRHAADHELPEAVQTLAMAYRNGELGLARDEAEYHAQWIETAHALKHPVSAP
ncbi:sel1 repeat family protein [Burkholderia sp. FERM BP-3421]|uniref:tetratricopeptide repeat protein n=1 Tax=Burkholderia sp. FERM BP-3421 TaxID=1494466 RepID=UPI00235F376E|nr:tetratricopeptide repeat protein [Burkholderia sp. FERM BP-3421]WDD95485.1 sel1 repeat family protein [Burkholderia sp. FERM BP-3421]